MAQLRVGVSGHRALTDPDGVGDEVDRVLDRLVASSPAALVVVSSLAEGADRIVAERVLARRGARLEVLLPLPPEDYETDFADDESRREFRELLRAADRVTVVPADPADPSREGAYARAGVATVAGCDVLLALWDGRPAQGRGGTAEVVAHGRAVGRPVEVIHVHRAIA